MRSILRNILFNSFSLYLLPVLLPGVTITGGVQTLLIAGFVLTLLHLVLKPILALITLPLRVITFGLIAIVINALLLYLLTIFMPQIKIVPFSLGGATLGGVFIPKVALNGFMSYIVTAVVVSVITFLLRFITISDE